jgi:peptide/nickel transport system substrate-binding protein
MNGRHLRWRVSVLAALALTGAAVIGISSAQSASVSHSRAAATVLVDGTTDSVVNLDPAGEYDEGSLTATQPIFQGLLATLPGPKIVPSLATKCSFEGETLKTFSCTLRKGVKFQNGDPFTSTDVKWSFDRVKRIKDPSGIYTLLDNLKSVTTSGPYSVTFHLAKPQASWPAVIAAGNNVGFIVDHTVYPANKLLPSTSKQVGTGPYVLSKYTPAQQSVYTRWDGFWGAPPKNDGLIIRYYTKSSTMKLALQRGDLDMVFREFTPTEYLSLKKTKDLVVHTGTGVVIRYLAMNVKRAPTDNIAVRKAIAYLMPRQTIASRIYHGLVKPLYSQVPGGMSGHIDAFKTVYGASPNVAKAKAVIKAAGVATPIALTIWYTPSHYGDASADEYAEIQRALQASGLFKVTLQTAEWATYSKTWGSQYDVMQAGWFPDYVDPEDYLTSFYLTGSYLMDGYSNPTMDALLAKQAGATGAKRPALLQQAQMLAAKDVPVVPYWQGLMIAVSHPNVHGIDSTLDSSFIMRFWLLSKS